MAEPTEKKSRINVTVTRSEHAVIAANANREGMPMGKYLLSAAMNWENWKNIILEAAPHGVHKILKEAIEKKE